MYEHLPATATREELVAKLNDANLDGVMIEYPLNEIPDWVFVVGKPEMQPADGRKVLITYHTYHSLPEIKKFNLIVGMVGTGKTNVVNFMMKRLVDNLTWPHFHIAHLRVCDLYAANGDYPTQVLPFTDEVYTCFSEGDMLAYINSVLDRYENSKENHVLVIEDIEYIANTRKENFLKGYLKAVERLKRSNITTIFTAQQLDGATIKCTREGRKFYANGIGQPWCTRDMYGTAMWETVRLLQGAEEG